MRMEEDGTVSPLHPMCSTDHQWVAIDWARYLNKINTPTNGRRHFVIHESELPLFDPRTLPERAPCGS